MPAGSTSSAKRALAPSAMSTPPTSPSIPIKRVRLTYSSTNEALKDLNKAKEEASLSHIIEKGISPQLVEVSPKGKGRYKLQWNGKNRTFMAIGTVSAHDVMVKKEVNPSFHLKELTLSPGGHIHR